MQGFLLQLLMVAADTNHVSQLKLRQAFRDQHDTKRPYIGSLTFSEYVARFNGWYLKLAHHVHNTELL